MSTSNFPKTKLLNTLVCPTCSVTDFVEIHESEDNRTYCSCIGCGTLFDIEEFQKSFIVNKNQFYYHASTNMHYALVEFPRLHLEVYEYLKNGKGLKKKPKLLALYEKTSEEQYIIDKLKELNS